MSMNASFPKTTTWWVWGGAAALLILISAGLYWYGPFGDRAETAAPAITQSD